jgi:hypothetical protein
MEHNTYRTQNVYNPGVHAAPIRKIKHKSWRRHISMQSFWTVQLWQQLRKLCMIAKQPRAPYRAPVMYKGIELISCGMYTTPKHTAPSFRSPSALMNNTIKRGMIRHVGFMFVCCVGHQSLARPTDTVSMRSRFHAHTHIFTTNRAPLQEMCDSPSFVFCTT